MCIILDANCYGDFSNRHEDMKPVHNWLDSGGKIVYSLTSKFRQEVKGTFGTHLLQWERVGRLKKIAPAEVEKKQKIIFDLNSDDSHIIALALVSNVKVLVSKDKYLHKDFKKYVRQGRVYQKEAHKHLLKKDTCP